MRRTDWQRAMQNETVRLAERDPFWAQETQRALWWHYLWQLGSASLWFVALAVGQMLLSTLFAAVLQWTAIMWTVSALALLLGYRGVHPFVAAAAIVVYWPALCWGYTLWAIHAQTGQATIQALDFRLFPLFILMCLASNSAYIGQFLNTLKRPKA